MRPGEPPLPPTRLGRSEPDREPLGRFGERRAEEAYRSRGAEVLARNFRCREGELDLVVVEGGVLAAVEVKTRTTRPHDFPSTGRPAEAVTASRLRRLEAALLQFRAAHRRDARRLRIDVVEVLVGRDRRDVGLHILFDVTR